MTNQCYVTTPIYYVNDIPHIGHAYTSIAADVIARFARLNEKQVFFLTGTDEHGQKIEKSAIKQNLSPKDFVDNLVPNFIHLLSALNCSQNDFIRTSEKRHIDFVQKVWTQMVDKDQIYLDKYSGWYSVRDEAFYKENDLIDGKAPTGASVEWIEEESYFFRLSQWQEHLLQFYDNNPNFISPETRKNEVISFVKRGLHDLSISRSSFSWGIPVPNNAKHVIYVWLDALFNYISAIDDDGLQSFWPCDLHIIGKDILIFHAVYWPAFLMSLNIEPPKKIFAHGWWLNEGQKISKSLGNVIDPIKLIDEFGVDYFRYFLMREISFGSDGNYSRELFIQRINSELANNIGNLIQRTLAFIWKNCDGIIEKMPIDQEVDKNLLKNGYETLNKIENELNKQAIQHAIGVIIEFASLANCYIDSQAPWNLKKQNNFLRMKTVLYVLAESIRIIGILLQPFVPNSSLKIMQYFSDTYSILPSIKHNIKEKHAEFISMKTIHPDFALNSQKLKEEPIAIFKRLI